MWDGAPLWHHLWDSIAASRRNARECGPEVISYQNRAHSVRPGPTPEPTACPKQQLKRRP